MIRIRTLGALAVDVSGAPPPPDLLWRKNLGLLLYLARSPRQVRTREHLVGLLWADKPDGPARHSLSEAIRTLRAALGDEQLDTAGGQVRLHAEAVRLDVDDFERLIGAGDWAAATAFVGGQFCEGFAIEGASEFDNWLAAERDFWQRRQVDALLHRADDLERRGFATNAALTAERALALDPASEPAIRSAMRSLALAGDRAAALRRFERFQQELTERVGVAPDAETMALVERLKRAQGLWRRTPAKPSEAAETRRLPLMGREQELERLLEIGRTARTTPRAAVAVIEAYGGLGRSRLLEELAERTALDGASVVAARAVPADRADPASGLLALASGGLLEAPGIVAAPADALGALAQRVAEWAERFRTIPASEPVSLPRAFSDIVRAAAAERPVLLVVDDAQWLDGESYGALEVLLRDLSRAPVSLVLSASAESATPELDSIRARFGHDLNGGVVRLLPLGAEDVARLVAHVMPAVTDPQRERLARRVLADSAGVPLLAVELVHAIASGLDPEELAGGWPAPLRTLDHTLPGDLPDTLVAAIRVGFRRLSADAQRILKTAAVLGDRLAPRELSAITNLGEEATAAALDELEWSRWLLADARGYAFVARIVRDVIGRDMLTRGERQRIAERRRHLGLTSA